jgi:hypothetical protein
MAKKKLQKPKKPKNQAPSVRSITTDVIEVVEAWRKAPKPGEGYVPRLDPVAYEMTIEQNAPAESNENARIDDQSLPSVKITGPRPANAMNQPGSGPPIEGVRVRFDVESGGGTVTGWKVATDANGIATIRSWTLGRKNTPEKGLNILRATAEAPLTPEMKSAVFKTKAV